jgi:hypothetical protein
MDALRQAKAVASAQRVAPEHQELSRAIAREPEAKLAIAAGRGLSEALATLGAGLGASGIVSAAPSVTLPRGFWRAPDFESMPGVHWLSRRLSGATALQIEVSGAADGHCDDLHEAARVGMAIVSALVADAELSAVSILNESTLHAEFSSSGLPRVSLVARSMGSSVRIQASTARTQLELHMDATGEQRVLRSDAGPVRRNVAQPPAVARALSALAGPVTLQPRNAGPARGDTADAALAQLAPSPQAFVSLRRAASAASEQHWPWQIAGAREPDSAVETLVDPPGTALLELAAFEAGLKPAVMLPRSPRDAERLAQQFAYARVLNTPRGTLFLAAHRGPDLAELGRLRSADDPDAHLREIGALLGYPGCCVDAFQRLSDRSLDARTRYAAALATQQTAPWSWFLNDTGVRVLPYFPCSYTCAAAVQQARAVLEVLRTTSPAAHAELVRRLAAPVLYFDDGAYVRVEPVATNGRRVGVPPDAPKWLRRIARALATPGVLQVTADHLQIDRDGVCVAALDRMLPFGLWLPFATDLAL